MYSNSVSDFRQAKKEVKYRLNSLLDYIENKDYEIALDLAQYSYEFLKTYYDSIKEY